jgi:outer membrane lipoprotein-sorting protein
MSSAMLKKSGGSASPFEKGGSRGIWQRWQVLTPFKSPVAPLFQSGGLVVLFCLMLGWIAVPAWALDGNQILQQVDRNMEPSSYEEYRKLSNIEPDGSRKEYLLYLVKKGRDKIVALFLSPASDKGRATLRLGENMWLYIPNVGRPIRITSLQSVVGGVFNNADILRIDFTAEYNVDSAEEKPDTYLLSLKAKGNDVAYDRLKMTVDKKTLLPVTIEAYAASGLLIKTLHYGDVKNFGNGIVRPAVLETDSPLYKGYKSVMVDAQILKREFPDEVFTLNYLSRVADLRK